ncbi:MAG: hypothetical protein JEZ09_21210 [Salinivirgaceae bacterium]|nr:hypothetical protein [Salinivirgaceae bacterium]
MMIFIPENSQIFFCLCLRQSSTRICEQQISREKALELIKQSSYNRETIEADKDYIAKKFNISRQQLDSIIAEPAKSYRDYPNDEKRLEFIYRTYRELFPKK